MLWVFPLIQTLPLAKIDPPYCTMGRQQFFRGRLTTFPIFFIVDHVPRIYNKKSK